MNQGQCLFSFNRYKEIKLIKLKSWVAQSWRLKLQVSLALVVAIGGISDRALGQITPDTTLGAETSIVIPNFSQGGIPSNRIEGGAIRGINLFHSFEEFNIEVGRGAYFNNPSGIENILSRVTGSNPSNIFGRLGVLGNANLFLINPNGIIFGADATLNIFGSFVATTANTIQFSNQGFFSTTASDISPVLTINPTAFLFNQVSTGAIINQSQLGLQVLNSKSLLLVGGNVTLEGGILQAPGGQIEVVGVAEEEVVGLNVDGKNLSLSFSPDVAYADISLNDGAVINASSSSLGGKIQIQGRDISLSDGAVISASGAGGGNIQVQGRRVTVTEGSQIVAITQGSKAGGTLTINASELVQVAGISTDGQLSSSLSTQVNPPSNQDATGTGGNLTINTGRLIIQDGAQVSTGTFSTGQGGTLSVNASDSIELRGTATLEDGTEASSGLFTQTNGAGVAGDLTINTLTLVVRDGAQVSASTKGEGQGGRLSVNALESVEVVGTAPNLIPSGLFAVTEGSSSSGTLLIETGQLIIRDGAVATTSTLGAGNGGSLSVSASESIELSGTTTNGEFPSGLFVGTTNSGAAGDLTVNTFELTVRDGALISVRSLGSGQAGKLSVTASSIQLDNEGSLSATTLSGNGGDITLQVQDLLLMRDRSTISTSAGTTQAGGDGGNIKIDANFIVAVPSEDSDISANAYTGRGGNIGITTQNLFGIQFRPQATPQSDITASSTFGIDGTVQINTPDIDPSSGLTNLPTDLVDASNQIAQNCRTGGTQVARNEFIITGRGGLPDNPNEALSTDTVWTDLRSTARTTLSRSSSQDVSAIANSTRKPLVEAQGWVINDKGKVVLMAQTVPVLSHNPWQTTAGCPMP